MVRRAGLHETGPVLQLDRRQSSQAEVAHERILPVQPQERGLLPDRLLLVPRVGSQIPQRCIHPRNGPSRADAANQWRQPAEEAAAPTGEEARCRADVAASGLLQLFGHISPKPLG